MKTEATQLVDVQRVDTVVHRDERGGFSRLLCTQTFAELGLPTQFVQSSLSINRASHTLRGMHFQIAPSNEGKLVRCLQGRICDALVDLRPGSPTYRHWETFELNGDDLQALWVPAGFAHGFLTLADNTLVEYHMTDVFQPELGRGLRWDDPALGIQWPGQPRKINERDANYPDLKQVLAEPVVAFT